MSVKEYNFDGLVGPTHNYAGLALGNLAATKQQFAVSNPKQAALEGIKKMRALADLGISQAVIPPHHRPHIPFLKALGFSGSEEQILRKAANEVPRFFAASYSASSMWTANMATVSASRDTADGKMHFTAANLVCNPHRALEATFSHRLLQKIFNDDNHFVHHQPLPMLEALGDEGAANHSRICVAHDKPGIDFFVYGKVATDPAVARPQHFPARQSFEASTAIARHHQLNQVIYAQQNPGIIDLGVFHNDVICVINENVMLYHQQAFMNKQLLLEELKRKCPELYLIEIADDMLSVPEAVQSYLFNSQLVTLPDQTMALVSPAQCAENKMVAQIIEHIVAADNPIKQSIIVDCLQSMQNGGGPACLRLRVPMNEAEVKAAHAGVFFDQQLAGKLEQWVETHYRDQLNFDDLLDPTLLDETKTALDELTKILDLGTVYDFQRG